MSNEYARGARRWGEFESRSVEAARIGEITDIAERLLAPMESSFIYEPGPDGKLCYFGQPIESVFVDGVRDAAVMAQANPALEFEYRRRCLELREYYDMEVFAKDVSEHGDVMVTISRIPEEVVSGASVDAYSRDRMKTMVRIYEHTASGLRATSLSLDRSDAEGLRAVARLCGEDIPDEQSSEALLARRLYMTRVAADESPATTIRRAYDAVLKRRYGGTWYAGRQDDETSNAFTFVRAQPELVDRHMNEIAWIRAIVCSDVQRERLLEDARYTMAAALSAVMSGEMVTCDADIDAAGSHAREEGVSFSRDCLTVVATAQQSIDSLFGHERYTDGVCRVCLVPTVQGDEETKIGPCRVCRKCEAADTRGESLTAIHDRARYRDTQLRRQELFDDGMRQQCEATLAGWVLRQFVAIFARSNAPHLVK